MTDEVETPEPTAESEEEQPEGEEPEAQAQEDEPSDDDPVEPKEEKPKSNRFQERITQLTQRAKEAEKREKELQERLTKYEQPEVKPRPKLEEFDYDEDKHAAALDEWYASQSEASLSRVEQKRLKEDVDKSRQDAARAVGEAFQERSKEFAEGHTDYYETIHNPAFGQGQAVTQAILNSDNGPALAYHLGKNLHLTNELNAMNPIHALMEIGRIEAKLSTPVAPQTTQAPTPQKPPRGSSSVQKDPDKMSPEEYRKMREKQLRDRSR